MSADNVNDATDTSCCASCGIAEIDDIKLVPCDGCDLARYCSDRCRLEHKSYHKEACKKRAAELRDELLFRQPESSHLGDCPICMLPQPLDKANPNMNSCCSTIICNGCFLANSIRQREQSLNFSCPFCRKPAPKTEEESAKRRMKRIEMNDPAAMCQEGIKQYKKGEYIKAFEYFTKIAELGDANAHYHLAGMYHYGRGVEKDEGKGNYHLEEAAIGGHPNARYTLGCMEAKDFRNAERAVKHWTIAATQGDDHAIKKLLEVFKAGFMGKDDLTAALRAHKAAVDETKSPERKLAEEYHEFIYG